MNKLEDRLRDGLHGAADRFPEVGTSLIRESSMRRRRLFGPAIAMVTAVAVVVSVGGVSLLTSIPDNQKVATIPDNQDTATSVSTVEEEPAPSFVPDSFESAFQREIIEDGVVTFDELGLAMSAWVGCVRDEGFDPVGGSVNRDGSSQLTWYEGVAKPAQAEEERFAAALDRCQIAYFSQVNTFYGLTHPQEWVDPLTPEVSGEIAGCIAALGVNLDSTPEGTYGWQEALAPLGDDAAKIFRQCEAQVLPPVLEEVPPPPGD